MFKKTMFVVGALAAAAMSMPDVATAAPHHVMRFHTASFAARAPRRPRVPLLRTSMRRPAPGRLEAARRRVAVRYERVFAPVRPVLAPRGASAWRRLARRSRLAAIYRPVSAYPRTALLRRRVAARGRVASAFRPIPARFAALVSAAAAPIVAAPLAVASSAAASAVQTGRASFYHGGGRTAAGGRVGAATCAHRWLPFGTKVLVTNLANARRAVLTVNDRGPFVGGRIVDVSMGAAGMLGMLHSGTAPVSVQVVGGHG